MLGLEHDLGCGDGIHKTLPGALRAHQVGVRQHGYQFLVGIAIEDIAGAEVAGQGGGEGAQGLLPTLGPVSAGQVPEILHSQRYEAQSVAVALRQGCFASQALLEGSTVGQPGQTIGLTEGLQLAYEMLVLFVKASLLEGALDTADDGICIGEGFGQVIMGTQTDCPDGGVDVVSAGEEDDLGAGRFAFDRGEKCEAIQLWHMEVGDDHVVGGGSQVPQGFRPALRLLDLVATDVEVAADHCPDDWRVIYREHPPLPAPSVQFHGLSAHPCLPDSRWEHDWCQDALSAADLANCSGWYDLRGPNSAASQASRAELSWRWPL